MIMPRQLLLYRYGTTQRTVDAVKDDKQGVTGGLHQPAAMIADGRIDQGAPDRHLPTQRAGVVLPYQKAIADHVRIEDRDKLAVTYRDIRVARDGICHAHASTLSQQNTAWRLACDLPGA